MTHHTSSTVNDHHATGGVSMDHATTTAADRGADSAGGEDVLKILASVEEQFARLRAAKKSQEDAFAAMAERNRLLHLAEQELRQLRQDVARQQQSLQADRDRLNAEAHQLNSQRQKLDAEISSQRQARSELETHQARWHDDRQKAEASLTQRESQIRERQAQVDRAEAELQRERERIASVERDCQQQRESLNKRAAQLEKEHADLTQRVTQAEANVGQLIKDIEQSQSHLAEKTDALEKAVADGKTLNTRVRELEKALTRATQQVEKLEREAVDMAKIADQERNEQKAKSSAQLKDLTAARDAAVRQAEAAQAQATSLNEEVTSLKAQLAKRESLLADHKQKLETATGKLSEFASVLAEQTPQLERGAAALVMVEQQHEQIERLTQQLAEMQLRTDPEEAIRREQRIVELTEALRQARGQSVNSLGVADIERRNSELTAEVERLKVEAGNATLAAEEARRQLQEATANASAPVVQDAMAAQQAAKIAALTAELEQARSHRSSENQAEIDSRVAAEVEAKLKSHRHDTQKSKAHVAEIAQLRDQVRELEQELTEARTTAAAAATPSSSPSDPNEVAGQLRQKAQRITAVAEHLRRRRQRLQKLRMLMASHGAQHHAAGAARQEELDQERQQIAELRRLLAASEQTMIRRWARPRAVASVVWIAILAVICGGTSWLIADHTFPPHVAASVALQAKTTNGQPMSDEQAVAWRQWHTGLFSDKAFIQTLSKRMAERRIDRYADAGALSQRLADDLTIDSSQKNSIILTLAGSDPEEVQTVLDVATLAVITESGHKLGNRADAAWAIAPGERTEQGRIKYSKVNDIPISDERLTAALPIFGGLFLTTLALIGVVYTRLMTAKRVFDQDNAAIFADAKIAAT